MPDLNDLFNEEESALKLLAEKEAEEHRHRYESDSVYQQEYDAKIERKRKELDSMLDAVEHVEDDEEEED